MRTMSKACVLFSVISSLLFFGCVEVSDPPDYRPPGTPGSEDVAPEPTDDGPAGPAVRIPPGDNGSPGTDLSPVLLARDQNVQDMAVDSNHLYWTSFDAATSTGSVMMVVQGEQIARTLSTAIMPAGITSDKDYLYWADMGAGSIVRMSMTTGKQLRLASGLRSPFFVAEHGSYVYFTDINARTVNRVNKTGGNVTILAADQDYPAAISVGPNSDGTMELYWGNLGDSGTLMAMPLDGGSPRVLVSDASFSNGFVIDGSNILWADTDARAVSLYSQQFGKSAVLANQQYTVAGLASDNSTVYWITQNDGAIHTLSKVTGETRTLIAGQDTPDKLLVNDSHIFWADKEYGLVWALAK